MVLLRVLLVGAVAALVATGAALASSQAVPKLIGTVGPTFTITLKDVKGKTVKNLKPGKYTFVVSDKARFHNFHLRGPGVNKVVTGVDFVGKKTVTLTLKKGRYTYLCDPHSSSLRGSFTVA